MDSPRRSARLAAKPPVDYTEPDYPELNDYQRNAIQQAFSGVEHSYTTEACAALIGLTVISFITAYVATTSKYGL